MPITTELQNTRELKEAGFSDQQAEKLAELFERSAQQGFEKFTETLVGEFERFRNEMRSEVNDVRSE
ncbi:MAG: hypothetical protein V3S29_13540, partial [bacterium]